jgi:hypothetical protein
MKVLPSDQVDANKGMLPLLLSLLLWSMSLSLSLLLSPLPLSTIAPFIEAREG